MPTPVTMPQLAETTTEGTIGKWLKQAGEAVNEYDPLVEIMTDKVNVEMPSPVSGILVEILAREGETVPVGGVLARIEEAGGGGEGEPERVPTGRAPELSQQAEVESPPSQVGGPSGQNPGIASPGGGAHRSGSNGRQRLTPVVARLAEQHQVDVTQLTGSGIEGRVTKQDILRFLEEREQGRAPTPQAPAGQGAGAVAASRPPEAPETRAVGDEVSLPITTLRRAIAENMVRSKTTAPHAWTMTEVDVSNLVRIRESMKEGFRRQEGVDLTYLPFFLKAVAETLREHPSLNASWADDRIIVKRRINIGIAVNRDEGLIVPVIKDADRLSLSGLAHAVADSVARARNNTLRPEDVAGGTFTLNNTGALGVTLSYPILVPGQAAILTTEGIVKRPVVIEDAIAIRSMMNMAIAFDHRITDGGIVGSFLKTVRSRLESMAPSSLQ